MKNFKIQFCRMLSQKGFRICFIVVLMISFVNSYLLLQHCGNYRGYLIDLRDTAILNFYSPLVDIFHLSSMLLLLLPYSLSNTKSSNSYYNLRFNAKMSYYEYCVRGMFVSFAGTFIAFFAPLVVGILLNGIFFGSTGILGSGFSIFELNGASDIVGSNCNDNVMNPGYCIIPIHFYLKHSQMYNMLYAALYGMVMGGLAMLFFQVSSFFKKKSHVLVLTYLIYAILLCAQTYVDRYCVMKYNINFFAYITVGYNMNLYPFYMALFLLFILCMSILLIRIQERKNKFFNK